MTNFLVYKELSNICSLITGQLQNLTKLGIHKNRTVAFECLFQSLSDFENIKIISKALYCCNTLSSVTLLDTNMNFGIVLSGVAVIKRVW